MTLLLATAGSLSFAEKLAAHLRLTVTPTDRKSFPDGEQYLRLPIDDRFALLNQDVVLVGSTDTDAALLELYRLACAAVKDGARSLTLVIPYFGYSTMERAVKPGEVVTAKTVARQLSIIPRAPAGNRVLLMDLHATGIVHYFEGDLVTLELYAEFVLIEAIEALKLENLCLASTDMGRAKWVETFANRLDAPVALIHKKRLSGSQTKINAVVGDVAGRDVVIFDDMIRTGGSLIQAAEAYLLGKARTVQAVTTHLVLPPGTMERLESSELRVIVGTDTHPNSRLVEFREKFRVVSVAGVFADVIGRMVGDTVR
jgi:ribose-phosphate pyrophosphokinase